MVLEHFIIAISQCRRADGPNINERVFWFILRVWKALHLNYVPFKYFWEKKRWNDWQTSHSFHSGTWLTICGHSVNMGFCNYKVFQNHIYYNKNLFRITELYKDSSILFVFRAILTKLQLLGKNHFHDLASKCKFWKIAFWEPWPSNFF